ncbi:MAG: hypothetical protein ACKVKN_08925 [Pseudomonadales bacterium]|jgi:hypothetical protein|tara:strand:- start:481 stop:1140 length:660 start_codon:yes stop_codon:yes gene_type:complete
MQNPESNTSNVQVLVDLKDPESVVGIMAIANWSKDRVQTVQVWPFVREPINTAAEVPRGDADFEAYKARRSLARHNYKSQERDRNLQRLSLTRLWQFSDAGAILAHWGLLRLAAKQAPVRVVAEFVSELVACDALIDADWVQSSLRPFITSLDVEMRAFDPSTVAIDLAQQSLRLSEQGVLSAPSMIYQGEVFSSIGHLPRLSDLCKASLSVSPSGAVS